MISIYSCEILFAAVPINRSQTFETFRERNPELAEELARRFSRLDVNSTGPASPQQLQPVAPVRPGKRLSCCLPLNFRMVTPIP